MKIQPATKRETLRIALGVLILSIIMQAIFYFTGYWDISVVLGNLLGGGFAIVNFFLMGLTVQKMAANPDIKRAKLQFQASYSGRQFAMFVVAGLGLYFGSLNAIAVIVPLLFPKFVILFLQVTGQYKPKQEQTAELEADTSKTDAARGDTDEY